MQRQVQKQKASMANLATFEQERMVRMTKPAVDIRYLKVSLANA